MNFIPSNRSFAEFHASISLTTAALCVLCMVLATPTTSLAQDIWYVDDDAPLGGDGESWTTAFRYLQDALTVVEEDDRVHVAQGVYKPDQDEFGFVTPGDRYASFELVSGVGLYGGYAGRGTANPDERDVALYETILTGDLGGDDGPDFANYGENSHHVVWGEFLDNDTVLDGLTLTAGNSIGAELWKYGGALWAGSGFLRITDCSLNNSVAEWGGAIYSESTITMKRCSFAGNEAAAGGGGAIITVFASTTIVDCIMRDNRASGDGTSQGGGAVGTMWGALYCSGCIFTANTAEFDGGAVLCGQTVNEFANCAFVGNSAPDAGAIYANGVSSTITNSTFWANSAAQDCGGFYAAADATISNCIFWENSDAGGMDERAQIDRDSGEDTVIVSYSCIQNYSGSFGTDGVISDYPGFIDPDGDDDIVGTSDDDLRLSSGSPCIDAGDNDAVPWDLQDLDGDGVLAERIPFDLAGAARFVDDPGAPDTGLGTSPIVDMGAYEKQVQGFVISASEIVVPEGGMATFTVALSLPPANPVSVTVTTVAGDSDISVQSGGALVFDSSNFNIQQTVTLAAALDADDVNGETTLAVSSAGFMTVYVTASEADVDAPPTVVFVDAAAQAGGDGTSWGSAFNDLQDALIAADGFTEPIDIWVAAGVYTPDRGSGDTGASFGLRNDVALLGGFAGDEDSAELRDPADNETILSGDLGGSLSARRVVVASYTHETAILDGFTVRDGDGRSGPGLYMLAGSPTILRCRFVYNHSSSDGAIFSDYFGMPVFVGCSFVDNWAGGLGGAVLVSGADAMFVDCRFMGNQANQGGAIHVLEGTLWLANCRFLGNNSNDRGAALYSVAGDVFAMNCIFSGQETATDGTAYFNGGWTNLVNCDFSHNVGRGIVASGHGDIFAYNSVFWGNTYSGQSGQEAQISLDDGSAELDIRFSCVQGWTGSLGGIGNHGAAPLFVDADGPDNVYGTEDDDLHLSPGSPCIDSGHNFFVFEDFADLDGDGDYDEFTPLDLDGEGRFVDDPNTPDDGGGMIAIVDMGAYEFGEGGQQYVLGDLTGDGIVNIFDIAILLANYGTPSGAAPYQGDIDADGDVDLADLAYILAFYAESGD